MTMQLAKIFLVGMPGLPILSCILATGGESVKDAVLFLNMMTLICSLILRLWGCLDCRYSLQVCCCMFVVSSGVCR